MIRQKQATMHSSNMVNWEEYSSIKGKCFICSFQEKDLLKFRPFSSYVLLTRRDVYMHQYANNHWLNNGLSPGRRRTITWTNAGTFSIRILGTNFSEILRDINVCSFKKMHLKMSSAKWWQFCLGLNVLTYCILHNSHQRGRCYKMWQLINPTNCYQRPQNVTGGLSSVLIES